MAKKLARMFVVMLLVAGLVSGCASFKKNAFSTLDSTRIAVDTTMQVAGDLYARGVIDDNDKDEIIEIHDKYRAIHQLLCELLKMYDALSDDETAQKEIKEQILEAVAELSRLAGEITAIVTEYMERNMGAIDSAMLQLIIDEHPVVNLTI